MQNILIMNINKPNINEKISFIISITESENIEVTGSIIDVLPDGRVKAQYLHPIRNFNQITIVDTYTCKCKHEPVSAAGFVTCKLCKVLLCDY